MIKEYGDLGIYQLKPNGQLVVKSSGRKYSTRKDSKTAAPKSYSEQHLKPKEVRVGDIIDFGKFRREDSYIVGLDRDKKLVLMELPDEGASGYGTIPLSVSSFFKNAIDAYRNQIDIELIHLSPRDKGLKEYFFKGKTVPRKYTYTYDVANDEVIVHDPVSKKTIEIDRTGDKLAPYLNKYFKTIDSDTAHISVHFEFNEQKKQQLKALQSQEQQQRYQKRLALYKKEYQEFVNDKLNKIKEIYLKNVITTEFDGGSGGSFHSNNKYVLLGSKKGIEKTKKQLLKLNETTPNGSLDIKIM